MKNKVFLSFIVATTLSCVRDKQPIKIEIASEFPKKEVTHIDVYSFVENRPCKQDKAISIIYKGKLDTSCFTYLKTIDQKQSQVLCNELLSPKTYGSFGHSCFDTDYALLLYNHKDVVIGYVNLSLGCLWSSGEPKIPAEANSYIDGEPAPALTKYGESTIRKLLGVK